MLIVVIWVKGFKTIIAIEIIISNEANSDPFQETIWDNNFALLEPFPESDAIIICHRNKFFLTCVQRHFTFHDSNCCYRQSSTCYYFLEKIAFFLIIIKMSLEGYIFCNDNIQDI